MDKKHIAIGLVVVAIIAIGGYLFPKVDLSQLNVGGSGVVTKTNSSNFIDGLHGDSFSEGGGIYATTTTVGTETLTQADLLKNNRLVYSGSTFAAAMTTTLPASSTWTQLLPSAGDKRTWVLENAYTAAATTTTIAAGTGIDLQEVDGGNVVIGINNYAHITCLREASTDIVCTVVETIPAD